MYEHMTADDVPHPAEGPMGASTETSGAKTAGWKRDSFDAQYIQRLKEGDPETERHFASYFGQLLHIKLRARLRNTQQVEDLSQETFLRVLTALRSKDSLRSPESLGAFVNSVCNNLLFERYRWESRQHAVAMDEHFDAADETASVESSMVTEERHREVRRVLDELPRKDRELLRMIFYEEADRAEVCRLFQVEREYLRVLMHRAKARFRECLLERRAEGFQANA